MPPEQQEAAKKQLDEKWTQLEEVMTKWPDYKSSKKKVKSQESSVRKQKEKIKNFVNDISLKHGVLKDKVMQDENGILQLLNPETATKQEQVELNRKRKTHNKYREQLTKMQEELGKQRTKMKEHEESGHSVLDYASDEGLARMVYSAFINANNKIKRLSNIREKCFTMKMSSVDVSTVDDMIYKTMAEFEDLFWNSIS